MAAPFDLSSVPADGWFINYDVFMPVGLFPVPGGIATAGPGMLGVTRLKPGVTVTAANANLAVVSSRLLAANPKRRRSDRRGRFGAGKYRWRFAHAAAPCCCVGWRRAAHGLRECQQPAGGARRGSTARNRAPLRARRQPLDRDPAARG